MSGAANRNGRRNDSYYYHSVAEHETETENDVGDHYFVKKGLHLTIYMSIVDVRYVR